MCHETDSCSSAYRSDFIQEEGCRHNNVALSRSQHWAHLFEVVNNADKNMYEQRKDSLDRQYQTAFFFASCLIAVILDSYKWLTSNPTSSYIAQCFISASLKDHPYSHALQFAILNSTSQFLPFQTVAVINALWFFSLLLMCLVLLICSLSLRSLAEFRNFPQFEAKYLLAFRQMHYNGLRRFSFFVICDAVHLILPLAFALCFSGVILLLWVLNRHDSYVLLGFFCFVASCFIFAVSYPFFRSLLRGETTSSSFFPFTSASSWLLFKMGHWVISVVFKLVDFRKREVRPDRHILPHKFGSSLRRMSLQVMDSKDWLEYGCSAFLHPQSTEAIDILLAEALIWVDSNPAIEKNDRLAFSIYHCILDLKSPNVFAQLDYTPRALPSELAAIFCGVAYGLGHDGYKARSEAAKFWLRKMLPEQSLPMSKSHVYSTKHLHDELPYTNLCRSRSSNALQPKVRPLESILFKLETAKRLLASGKYYQGTFDIIYEIMVKNANSTNHDLRVREVTTSIFHECTKFISRFTFRDERHLQEVKLYAEELEVFVRNSNEIANDFCASLGTFWGKTIYNANFLLDNVENLLSHRLLDNSGANLSNLAVVATRGVGRDPFDVV